MFLALILESTWNKGFLFVPRDALKYKEKKPWSASISTQGLRSIS